MIERESRRKSESRGGRKGEREGRGGGGKSTEDTFRGVWCRDMNAI